MGFSIRVHLVVCDQLNAFISTLLGNPDLKNRKRDAVSMVLYMQATKTFDSRLNLKFFVQIPGKACIGLML